MKFRTETPGLRPFFCLGYFDIDQINRCSLSNPQRWTIRRAFSRRARSPVLEKVNAIECGDKTCRLGPRETSSKDAGHGWEKGDVAAIAELLIRSR